MVDLHEREPRISPNAWRETYLLHFTIYDFLLVSCRLTNAILHSRAIRLRPSGRRRFHLGRRCFWGQVGSVLSMFCNGQGKLIVGRSPG